MRTNNPFFRTVVFAGAVVLTLLASKLTVSGNSTNTTTAARGEGLIVQPPFIAPAVPQSTFNVPKKPVDGRDPFFPKSVRVYGVDPTTKPTTKPVPTIAELAFQGISGTPEQPLAIINNRTLTTGEEADVPIGAGKIRIRCVEINQAEGTVLVQAGGQTRLLRLPSK